MAWRCSGETNTALIENMSRSRLIKDDRVKAAFLKVDRAHYAPGNPYEDSPQTIGHGATISAPHMHASAIEHMISHLVPTPTSPSRRILDVGSGTGYLTHILAELGGEKSLVVGLEHIQELRDLGSANMSKSQEGKSLLAEGRVKFCVGDGRQGWIEDTANNADGSGYWDAIHVGASAKEVHPELLRQLKAPGCIFIPVDDDEEGYSQHVWRIEKDAQGEVSHTRLFGVRYVPLTDAPLRR